jgi:hypothetical protein
MTLILSIVLSIVNLFISAQIAFAKDCQPAIENLQKKLIIDHIYKYPLHYGKDVEVLKVETMNCPAQGSNSYLVHYHDTVCYELKNTATELVKCYKVLCQSPALVGSQGNIDFELASLKTCSKDK